MISAKYLIDASEEIWKLRTLDNGLFGVEDASEARAFVMVEKNVATIFDWFKRRGGYHVNGYNGNRLAVFIPPNAIVCPFIPWQQKLYHVRDESMCGQSCCSFRNKSTVWKLSFDPISDRRLSYMVRLPVLVGMETTTPTTKVLLYIINWIWDVTRKG